MVNPISVGGNVLDHIGSQKSQRRSSCCGAGSTWENSKIPDLNPGKLGVEGGSR
jgi:hypothetical protein